MTNLPPPSIDALQHSQQLSQHIHHLIQQQHGWISFADYMEQVLYAPGLGYYTAGSHKLGEAGDFITAPELSPLFGRTLARQVAEIMAHSASHVMELGAGSGKLALDVLSELEAIGQLPHSYHILEVSADLRARQQYLLQQHLPHLLPRISWLDKLPEHFAGAVIANEVLDALPVHLLQWSHSAVKERGVICKEGKFAWEERVLHDGELQRCAHKIQVPEPYISEICLAARGLINSLASCMTQGAMIFIDYGFGAREYYHPQRHNGTLMCHYRHHAHDDVFFLPGLQDITAHVNFTDIAETGIDAGLDLLGYTSQAFFLINCGITELMGNIQPDNVREYAPLSGQLQKLTSPAEMGELFKVIALGKNLHMPLRGFMRGDLSRTL